MEKLRKFKTEEEFLNIKNSLEYPQVSLTDDNGKVWVKEKENYILATFYITEDILNSDYPTMIIPDSYSDMVYQTDYIIIDDNITLGRYENEYGEMICESYYKFDTIGEHTAKIYLLKDAEINGLKLYCGAISFDFSNFDASKITSMTGMFRGCEILTSITFGDKFDTSNVITMTEMFGNCRSLTSLDLSSFDTSNVTDMSSMFDNCRNLTSLDLNGWDISKVEDGQCAFHRVNNDVVIGVDPTLDIFMCDE